ncbi:MAG: type VI secretion system baseplate subunit TssK, partial [Pseudomonadota bacterium]
MSWASKVLWTEGLLIQPHHFQQADRYAEALVTGLAHHLVPHGWGFSELEIDQEALKLGKFAVHACRGLTPDGAVFNVPQAEDHPHALEVPETVKDCVIYLTVPERRQGAVEADITGGEKSASRFAPSELEISDTMSKDRKAITLAVGKLRLGFALEVDDLADQQAIPVARVIEVGPNGELILDQGFMPTCLDYRAAAP